MIVENLLNFLVVILVQFIFLFIHAKSVRELSNLPTYLVQGMILGLPFGITFDVIIGKYVGMFDYQLGFTWWFLTINGILSYGIMIANVLLLFRHTLNHMYFWSVLIGLVYEVVNIFFPVWNWKFSSSAFEYLIVIGVAYAALTWLMMVALRLAYNKHFKLVPF